MIQRSPDPRSATVPSTAEVSAHRVDAGSPDSMAIYPEISTERFTLRPFVLTDIAPLAALAGRHRIGDTTLGVPHPYTSQFARQWINTHAGAWGERRALHWAAIKRLDEAIAGYCGLKDLDLMSGQAELRFWVGRGTERKRDALEWANAALHFAWTELRLERVYALQMRRHPLAGRVLAAAGLQPVDVPDNRIEADGPAEEVICWATSRPPAGWKPVDRLALERP